MPRPKPPAGRRFKKGQSGNPGGRPKQARTFRQIARAAVDEDLVPMLLEEVRRRGPERMRATGYLLAYGLGTPVDQAELKKLEAIEKLEQQGNDASTFDWSKLSLEEKAFLNRLIAKGNGLPLGAHNHLSGPCRNPDCPTLANHVREQREIDRIVAATSDKPKRLAAGDVVDAELKR